MNATAQDNERTASTPIELLERQLVAQPDALAVEAVDGTLTWRGLRERTAALAAALADDGVGPGDRVILAWPSSCAWVVSALAAIEAGAIAVPIDHEAPESDLRRVAELVEPRLVLGRPSAPAVFGVEVVASLPTGPPPGGAAPRPRPPSTPALIVTTSGTTGKPKGAVHALSTLARAGEGFAHWLELTAADRVLCCLPLYHVNAIFYSWLGSLAAGAPLIMTERFSASGFWREVERSRATEVNLIGSLLEMLLVRTTAADAAGHRLRVVYSAGASGSAQRRFEQTFGVRVVEGYGLSETPFGCVNGIEERRIGSLGRPRLHPAGSVINEVAIHDPDGNELPPGELGEIAIRNDAMFLEYWRDPESTAAAFRGDWFRTRDLGSRDEDGYFFFHGRLGDVIRRNGVNISPVELEQLLRAARWVDDAAVVGVAHEVIGEEVVAVVVAAAGEDEQAVAAGVLDHARATLKREQVPDRVVVVDELPFTVTGRVQRAKLREWLKTSRT